MANKATNGEPEVTHCVSNLIHAFTNGLDVFRRLRERRRRKNKNKGGGSREGERANGAELQLSNSLRRGPMDLRESYEDCYSLAGEKFAKGDSIAHASLAETLIKLNTGLVGIIAAFLNHDSKSHHLKLDYKSLTDLSDASRMEAIGSLTQLCQRVSQSQLQVYKMGGCHHCGSTKHQDCAGHAKNGGYKKKHHSGPRSRSNTPTIARVPGKSSSQTQLVVVRSKNSRKGSSSSSTVSSKSRSPASSSPVDSPMASPLPQYAPVDPFPPQPVAAPRTKSRSVSTSRGSTDKRPNTWPHSKPDSSTPPLPSPLSRKPLPPPKEKSSPPSSGPVPRRRMEKVTPSTYTFASDSTRLGEIPQRKWTTPFDPVEAERLNRQALINWQPPTPLESGQKKKKGIFGFLRRGSETS